ncbi:hypothetical protein [Amycolatopsis sp. NPDC050768]|uniref:hypothetical protein n=1 Tax=Amycolatopsis sp. NPDC050768 TaxID=3154839 RepID=UPI0034110794
MTLSIGFIGLGDQGAPLATAIAEAGFPLDVDLPSLVAVLKNGSVGSFTLSALGEAITAEKVEHLSKVELLDMDLFAAAMAERNAPADAVTARAVAGASGLVELMRTLTK